MLIAFSNDELPVADPIWIDARLNHLLSVKDYGSGLSMSESGETRIEGDLGQMRVLAKVCKLTIIQYWIMRVLWERRSAPTLLRWVISFGSCSAYLEQWYLDWSSIKINRITSFILCFYFFLCSENFSSFNWSVDRPQPAVKIAHLPNFVPLSFVFSWFLGFVEDHHFHTGFSPLWSEFDFSVRFSSSSLEH
jgi:hypothetical protein